MTIPEVKKYLGGQIRVRRLDSIRLRHALKSADRILTRAQRGAAIRGGLL